MFFAAAASCVFLCKVNNCNVTRAMCAQLLEIYQMLKLCHLKSFEGLLNFASCSVPLKYCFTATAELQLVNLAPRWFIATVAELGQNVYTSLSLSLSVLFFSFCVTRKFDFRSVQMLRCRKNMKKKRFVKPAKLSCVILGRWKKNGFVYSFWEICQYVLVLI